MDADILRLVLFILGAAFVAGIYFWDKRKPVDSRLARKRVSRKASRHDSSVFDQVEHRDPVIEKETISEPEFQTEKQAGLDIEPVSAEPVADELSFTAQPGDVAVDDDSLSFSSTDAFQE
ncbi:MAG: hypothetical protein KJO91_08645, partial [Gammaproteobacteria bacterium]|nr:hypothetical protein [Gammaproteobacteria bacterium]